MKDHSWLLTKKRGDHRTDSLLLGIISEYIFAIFCILTGIVGLVWLCVFFVIPEWRIHEQFEKTVCTLVDCRVVPHTMLNNQPISQEKNSNTLFDGADATLTTTQEGGERENRVGKDATPRRIDSWTGSGLFADGEIDTDGQDSNEVANNETGNVDNSTITGKNGKTGALDKKHPVIMQVQKYRENLQEIYYLPEMQLKYSVDDVERTNWTSNFGAVTRSSRFSTEESAWEFLNRWQKEERYYCLFNPEDPNQVVIMRDWQWENFLALTIPISLLFIGIGIATHAMTTPRVGSKEKTALLSASRSQEGWLIPTGDFPYIPTVEDITDSPGIRLAYRLPMIDSPAWTLCVLLFVTMAWNAGCVLFLTVVACSFFQSLSDWLMLCYSLPFVGVGLWLVGHTLIKFRNETAVGTTQVEVESFPIFPGKPIQVFLSQGGELPLRWLNVVLICEEDVVFTHGTNTRREKQRIYQRLIFGEERIDIAPDRTFEALFSLDIPTGAMHSFVSSHNQINWRLLVQGKLERFPMFERSFPLIVYPEVSEERK